LDVTDEVNEQLEKMAVQNIKGANKAEVVRNLINEGLAIEGLKNQEQIIRRIIRQEIDNKMDGYMNRIVSICVKGSITSSAAYFLSALALSDFVRPELQANFDQAVKHAKQMAVSYVGLQDDTVEDYLAAGLQKIRRNLNKGGTGYNE